MEIVYTTFFLGRLLADSAYHCISARAYEQVSPPHDSDKAQFNIGVAGEQRLVEAAF
jgi:hypothetical protein